MYTGASSGSSALLRDTLIPAPIFGSGRAQNRRGSVQGPPNKDQLDWLQSCPRFTGAGFSGEILMPRIHIHSSVRKDSSGKRGGQAQIAKPRELRCRHAQLFRPKLFNRKPQVTFSLRCEVRKYKSPLAVRGWYLTEHLGERIRQVRKDLASCGNCR